VVCVCVFVVCVVWCVLCVCGVCVMCVCVCDICVGLFACKTKGLSTISVARSIKQSLSLILCVDADADK